MQSLDIKLGGIRDLYALQGMSGIKYFELWQVMGLSDIGVISTLTGLQYLFLQSLCRVTVLPAFDNLHNLRRVLLENMRGLRDIGSLEHAPALEEFIHTSAQNMQIDDYEPLFRNPNLKQVLVGFGSDKRNRELLDHARKLGLLEYGNSEFQYR
jgi:hypothetical protein